MHPPDARRGRPAAAPSEIFPSNEGRHLSAADATAQELALADLVGEIRHELRQIGAIIDDLFVSLAFGWPSLVPARELSAVFLCSRGATLIFGAGHA